MYMRETAYCGAYKLCRRLLIDVKYEHYALGFYS